MSEQSYEFVGGPVCGGHLQVPAGVAVMRVTGLRMTHWNFRYGYPNGKDTVREGGASNLNGQHVYALFQGKFRYKGIQ